MNKNAAHQLPQVKRLVLHFNIDKTIVMKDSLTQNNIEFHLKEIICWSLWGKIEMKNDEKIYKLNLLELEPNRQAITDPELINYMDFLDEKFRLKPEEEETLNQEDKENKLKNLHTAKLKAIWEVTDTGNPGARFKKQSEDMRRKLRVDDKILVDKGYKVEMSKKFEELFIKDEEFKFHEEDDNNKYRHIFQNGFHQIILSFFQTMNILKKNKREFAIVFRFFGHDNEAIEEFIFEFNQFCEGQHPRFCGKYTFVQCMFNGVKSKDFRINKEKGDNMAVHIRNMDPSKETFIFDTIDRPEKTDIEDLRDNIEEYYHDGDNLPQVRIVKGFNNIYLGMMEKLAQNCCFVLIDDHPFYETTKSGRAFLVDPYDHETLQIFFDTDLEKHPDKLHVIDIANGSRLDIKDCLDKFVVNVDPRKAIIEQNYFLNKIEICEKKRLDEIENMGVYEVPVQPIPYDFNLEQEIKKLSADKYLEMAIFPLLHSALTITDVLRPQDPLAFIANFMLKNKGKIKKLEEIVEVHPHDVQEEMMDKNFEEMENELMEKVDAEGYHHV